MSEAGFMDPNKQWRFFSVPLVAVGLGVSILGGCMVGPNFHPPQPTVPNAWVGVEKTPTEPSTATIAQSGLTQWWKQFDDPVLTELVDEALKTNLDLRIAETRLREARAIRGVAVGGLWPKVTAAGNYQKVHPVGVTPGNQGQNLYQAGLDAGWELDLFGGQRRNIESADANIQAALENLRDAQVSLIAEVALNYSQLRGYQQEIVIAQNNLKAQEHTADITHRLLSVGFASALDAANADSNVATTESQIPVFESEEKQSIYALSVLLARLPGDLLEQLSPTGNLPRVPMQVPAGLPSDLLRRRPDIRKAEAQLHAATAQIGVAIADYFPTFSLTGTLNWSSNLLSSWWTNASRSFAAGPSMSWTLFQGGSIAFNVRLQEALRDESFITYQKTVLSAFQDVENALIAFAKEQQHHKSINDAVVANRKAVELSAQLYSAGQTDFINVLNAQRSLYSSEDALVQSERSIVIDLIALFKALGGGWESVPTISTLGIADTESSRNSK
jgi:outer membrane protein, multidrug efflux system